MVCLTKQVLIKTARSIAQLELLHTEYEDRESRNAVTIEMGENRQYARKSWRRRGFSAR